MSTAEYYWINGSMATPLIEEGKVTLFSDDGRTHLDPVQARLLAKMLTEAAEEAEAIKQRA